MQKQLIPNIIVKKKANNNGKWKIIPKNSCPGVTIITFTRKMDEVFKIRNDASHNKCGKRNIFFRKIAKRKNGCRMRKSKRHALKLMAMILNEKEIDTPNKAFPENKN